MRISIFISLLFIIACNEHSPQGSDAKTHPAVSKNRYEWSKVLDSGDWKKSYNFQMFTYRDTLWIFHSDGNWFSANGTEWTKSTLPNAIYNLGFLDYAVFNNAIYGFGHFEGNIEHYSFKPAIYRTTDARHWDTISHESNLPARFFYHPFVFDNKIWIIGGEDTNTKYADTWNSADGFNWKKQKDNLPFGKRSNSQVILFKDKLFLFNNDVWTSADALNWEQVTSEIVKGENVFGYMPVVFDNKIWLLGCNRNEQFSNKILSSEDGKTWQDEDAPWTPRGGIAAAVFTGKIFMTGGKYGGTRNNPDFRYSNDLWTMEKK